MKIKINLDLQTEERNCKLKYQTPSRISFLLKTNFLRFYYEEITSTFF